MSSKEYKILSDDLQQRVNAVASEIAIAALIDNVNLRGHIIEHLITSAEDLRAITDALHLGSPLPEFIPLIVWAIMNGNLIDYITSTDIKTKVLFYQAIPKATILIKSFRFYQWIKVSI